MIAAIIKTNLKEVPKTCRDCPYKKEVVGGHGNEYFLHCAFNGNYIEYYFSKKNPNCPLVDDEEVK